LRENLWQSEHCRIGKVWLLFVDAADSDEVARVKRDEAARDSWMMAPAVTE
jgi:hypothetical protein